ncbi:MAG: choice-of-anchor tandem repeat GloVer-containing protein [Bryobacteraceae bacterium]
MYTPLSTNGVFHLVATNTADPAQTAVATVNVVSPLKLELLHSFNPHGQPEDGLMQASDGNYYGTDWGGSGTVFRVTPTGDFAILYSFPGAQATNPFAPLLQGRDGDLYGTTAWGGSTGQSTVYKMDFSGDVAILRDFGFGDTNGTVGANAGLIAQDSDGNLYGHDGSNIWRIDLTGNLTVLHHMAYPAEGAPVYGLTRTPDGRFYGVAAGGGTDNKGTVFELSPDGTLVVLHSFSGPDGASPESPLVLGDDGSLYGTDYSGGEFGQGMTYKVDLSGNFTLLHSFSGPDGAAPQAPLIEGSDGYFYGTTPQPDNNGNGSSGGLIFVCPASDGCGAIIRMDPLGNITVLHRFTSALAEGTTPGIGGLLQDGNGDLLGTTQGGGAMLGGAVFRFSLSGAMAASLRLDHVGNAASFDDRFATRSLAAAYGTRLSCKTALGPDLYDPTSAVFKNTDGCTRVWVNGEPAPLTYTSPRQVNFQMPADIPANSRVSVKIERADLACGSTACFTNEQPEFISLAAPAFFVDPSTMNPVVTNANTNEITSISPADGKNYALWGQGLGPTSNDPGSGALCVAAADTSNQVVLTIGGAKANISYAGCAPLSVIQQVNFQTPSFTIAQGATTVDASLTVAGATLQFKLPAVAP